MIEFLTLGMHPVAFLATGAAIGALTVAWMWHDLIRYPGCTYRESPEGAWFVALLWTLLWPWLLIAIAAFGALFLAYALASGLVWCVGFVMRMVTQ
jgi:hypothetical protein